VLDRTKRVRFPGKKPPREGAILESPHTENTKFCIWAASLIKYEVAKMISEFLSPIVLWIGGGFLFCLFVIGLWIFWRSAEPRVYLSVVESLLTPAEQLFYRNLDLAINGRLQILCKVRLADLLQVSSNDSKERHRLFRKIAAKHIDFLLVEPGKLEPILAIELDDASHDRANRKQRDRFLDELFGIVEFPLLRVRAAASYSPRQILRAIEEVAGELV
jgi:hypothetical protein